MAPETPACPSYPDLVVECYMAGVDRTLLRRNLSLTHEERLNQLQELADFAQELKRAEKPAKLTPRA